MVKIINENTLTVEKILAKQQFANPTVRRQHSTCYDSLCGVRFWRCDVDVKSFLNRVQ